MNGNRNVCPWMGFACPGPERCAPAVMEAERANESRGPEHPEVQPVCPIVRQIEAQHIQSAAMAPLLFGGEDETEKEERQAFDNMSPERQREEVLKHCTIDQK